MTEATTMRKRLVASCGKGGTGKTAFTSMMTKVLLDSGKAGKLLLIDADPAMGLPLALEVNVKRTMGQIREEIIKAARGTKEEEKRRVTQMLDYMTFEALNEVDGFALLAMGRTETLGCYCPVNSILKDTISTLSKSFDTILIDGASLTVAEVRGTRVSVSVIPFTIENTTLKDRRVGDSVNVEFDIIGKYVARLLGK